MYSAVCIRVFSVFFLIFNFSSALASKKCVSEFLFQIGAVKNLPVEVDLRPGIGVSEFPDIANLIKPQLTTMLQEQFKKLVTSNDERRLNNRSFHDARGKFVEFLFYEEGRKAMIFNQFMTSTQRKFGRSLFSADLDIIPTSDSLGVAKSEMFHVIVSVADPVPPFQKPLSPLVVFAHKNSSGVKFVDSDLDFLNSEGSWKLHFKNKVIDKVDTQSSVALNIDGSEKEVTSANILGNKKILNRYDAVDSIFGIAESPLKKWIQVELIEKGFQRKNIWNSETIQTSFDGVPSSFGYNSSAVTRLSADLSPVTTVSSNSPYARMELWVHPTKGSLIFGVRESGYNFIELEEGLSEGIYFLSPFVIVPKGISAYAFLKSLGLQKTQTF